MQPFSYVKANDPSDASSKQKASGGGIFLGGGTCLVDLMKLDVMAPPQLIDVRKSSGESSAVKDSGKTVVISGGASNSAVAHHALIQSEFPVLSQAILSGASPQLRNAATVAGNLMQRTRCCYFRDPVMSCNKNRPGSGCPAIDGFNRMHAVLGTSDECIAAHPSDMCVALAALDAVVRVHDGSSHREIPLIEFHTLPGKNPEIETVLKAHEIITAVEITKSDLARHSHYHKVRDRASFSFALTSAAVALVADGGKIKEARLALGGVGTKPWRCQKSESDLQGKPAETASYRAAAALAMADAVPRSHNKFKIELAKRTVVRAYEELQKA
ncbi:MAG: xanthine dehydrogenase family protein subunit M [Candidatus Obscuribacterales bacterium]